MKVAFYDDYSVSIDENIKLKLGDILIEFISYDFTDFYSLCDNLIKGLALAEPTKNENTSLSRFLGLATSVKRLEKGFKEALLSLPFYRLSQPEYSFATDDILYTTNACLKRCDKDTLLVDALFAVVPDWDRKAIKIIYGYKKAIMDCSQFFKELVDSCLIGEDISAIIKLNDYGLDKIIHRMGEIENGYTNHFSFEHKIDIVNGSPILNDVYTITSPTRYLYIEFINIIKNGLRIKKCANCGLYFVLFSGHSIEYCDRIPEGEKKPCSLIGSARLYSKKVKDDPILENYTRSYKTHFSRKRAGYLTDEQFKAWAKEAKIMRSKAYASELSLNEFEKWLKK